LERDHVIRFFISNFLNHLGPWFKNLSAIYKSRKSYYPAVLHSVTTSTSEQKVIRLLRGCFLKFTAKSQTYNAIIMEIFKPGTERVRLMGIKPNRR
jgi:hypothetical protein